MSPLLGKFKNSFDRILQNSKRVVITSHVNPDSDSISSTLLTRYYIKKSYPNLPVFIFYTGDYVKDWEYFSSYKNVKFVIDVADELRQGDTFILVDVQDFDRVSFKSQKIHSLNLTTVCFDHHFGNTKYNWDLLLTKPNIDYVANTHLLYDLLFKGTLDEVPSEILELIYVGIYSDTGGFRYLNGSKDFKALLDASIILKKGNIYPDKVLTSIYKNTSTHLSILSKLLKNLAIHEPFGNWPSYVFTFLSIDDVQDFKESDVSKATFLFKPYLKSLEGAIWGFYVRPYKNLGWRISLRSSPGGINVGEVARYLGGNGHDAAAGALIADLNLRTPEKVLTYIKNTLRQKTPKFI